MACAPCDQRALAVSPDLVRRVNQLYHELTQARFDTEHRRRHRVERAFWAAVAGQSLRRSLGPRTVIDFGCGTGFVSCTLGAAMGTGDLLTSMDIAPAALESTARAWSAAGLSSRGSRLAQVLGDGTRLPFDSGSTDLFAMNAALHHIPDFAPLLTEIHRVLRPGGWFALGHEPTRAHFASAAANVSRAVDRLAWYASPRENRRRLAERMGLRLHADADAGLWASMNAALAAQGLIDQPLSSGQLLDLVDPHARGGDGHAGFDPQELLCRWFAGYEVARLQWSDYLGESMRACPAARWILDGLLGTVWPCRGMLFSWLIRKPERRA